MLHRIETTVGPDGIIVLNGLPLRQGDLVEIIVITSQREEQDERGHLLRRKPISYEGPFDSMAENEWSVPL